MDWFCWFMVGYSVVVTVMLMFSQRRWGQALDGWKRANDRVEQLLQRRGW